MKERIAFIQQYPVSAIEILTIRLLYQLIFHGHYDLALSYAEAVWKPLDQSVQLIGFPAFPFVSTIYVSLLQQAYEAHLNGDELDESKLLSQLVCLGFDEKPLTFDVLMLTLKEDFSKEKTQESINKGKKDLLPALNIHFLKYMLDTYQLPFIFSQSIWSFIGTSKIFDKHVGIDNWFYIDAKTLDNHILEHYDAFLDTNGLEVFGKVGAWILFLDFLHTKQLLSTPNFENMRENLAYFKNEMMHIANGKLWQKMFVFDWPTTNRFVVDLSEKNKFEETYGKYRSEAIEIVDRYTSTYQIPFRIKKELKLNNVKQSQSQSIWPKSTP